jgi:DNA-binding MarR family transcriptional regulator
MASRERTADMEPPEQDGGRLAGLTLLPACRSIRRSIGVTAWAVLEDVVMDAVVAGGRLLAATSARRVAEHLGVTPATAASALRRLRQRGLLEHERLTGPHGRFGLSVYRVHLVDGVALAPCVDEPNTALPRAEERYTAGSTKRHGDGVDRATRRRSDANDTRQLTLLTAAENSRD